MYYLLYQDSHLLLQHDGGLYEIPQGNRPPLPIQHSFILKDSMGKSYLAANVHTTQLPENPTYEWIGVRQAHDLLPRTLYQLVVKGAELTYWEKTNQYCGSCGTLLERHTDISKKCPKCQREFWPALALAVIVAITRNEGKELLMVQARNFKGDYYGLVAGFVETGETLEEALRREVMEETGCRITNIRYFGSQPWPYPSNLMVGFTAEWDGGELQLQESELRKGGWFTRETLPNIPGKVSLARKLIDAWLESTQNTQENKPSQP